MMFVRSLADLPDALFSGTGRWRPFATASDRRAWESLPQEVVDKVVCAAHEIVGTPWATLPAGDMMAFRRDGNRRRYEKAYFERRRRVATLVVAECCRNQGEFLDELINGLWLICEESSWAVPAHLPDVPGHGGLPERDKPVVDLFAADTASLLAWSNYLLEDQLRSLSTVVPERIYAELAQRLFDPAVERDDYWWMGLATPPRKLNNWTPWIVSNWLGALLLSDRHEARRIAGLYKAVACLDRYMLQMPLDGGCDEGPSYWGRAGASLFDALEILLSASEGRLNFYDKPQIKALGSYLAKVHIAGPWFVNFADGPARVDVWAPGVYGYGVRTGDEALMRLGVALQQRHYPPLPWAKYHDLFRTLQSLFTFRIAPTATASAPAIRDAWFPETEVMTARESQGEDKGWFVAAKGGHNNERHNHNDIGSFIVYRDGQPLLVDAGVGVYTRQTFSPERYSIWTMRSDYHNYLPAFAGVVQSPGVEFAARKVAYTANEERATLSLELAAAYPPEAQVAEWQRKISLNRSRGVVVSDSYRLNGEVGEITFSLLTPSRIELVGAGCAILSGRPLPQGAESGSGRLEFEIPGVTLAVEEVVTEDDERLSAVWGASLYRLVVRVAKPARTGEWLLSIRQPAHSPRLLHGGADGERWQRNGCHDSKQPALRRASTALRL